MSEGSSSMDVVRDGETVTPQASSVQSAASGATAAAAAAAADAALDAELLRLLDETSQLCTSLSSAQPLPVQLEAKQHAYKALQTIQV